MASTTVETFANLPQTTVLTGGTDAPVGGTQETWTVASSAEFPAASNTASPPTQFHVADQASGKNSEIVAVTNVSGTTWTVTRGAEGTAPVTHSAGFTIYQVLTAAGLGGMLQSAANLSDVASASTARANLGLGSAATLASSAVAQTADNLSDLASASSARANLGLGSMAVVASPAAIANGGTGQATQQAALDALAGAVTSGQVLRGNGTHVGMAALQAVDVPGFNGVTVTGTPSAGWVPTATSGSAASWQPAAGGVQSLTFTYGSTGAVPSSGTFTAGAVAVDQNDILRVCIASGTPGTWQRAGSQPYQFYVEDYGAKGDGKIGTGGTGTSGTTGFSDAGAAFTSADTGKVIIVNQGAGGSTQIPFTGTITFVDSTHLTLSGNLAANAASAPYIYGTDDAAAINFAVAAAAAYAGANNAMAEVVFQPRRYMLGAMTKQTTPAQVNSHIPIPYGSQTGQKLRIKFTGAGNASGAEYWQSTAPELPGTCLVSTVNLGFDGTFGEPSVIGTPNTDTSLGSNQFFNVGVTVDQIQVIVPWNAAQRGFDFQYAAQASIVTGAYRVFAPVNLGAATVGGPYVQSSTLPTNGNSIGLWMPYYDNNANSNIGVFTAVGANVGIASDEHLTATRVEAYCNATGIQIFAAEVKQHGTSILSYSAEGNGTHLAVSSSGGDWQVPLFIGLMDVEQPVTADISDPNNSFYGQVNWSNGVFGQPGSPVVSGAGNLQITSLNISRGHMASPPSVPATTVAASLVYRDGWVVIHTGAGVTVSAVTIAGTATGLTMAASSSLAVRVPSGTTIALTYSGGTPTWDWWLD